MEKINKQVFLYTVIVMVALYLFKGMLYVSENGWILLKDALSLDARVEEKYAYDTCYDMVLNGEHMYMICYTYSNKENYVKIPAEANRFSLITDSYGIVEFYAMKKDGKVECTLIDSLYIGSQEEQQLDEVYKILSIIEDFVLEFWKGNGLTLIDYGYINEGRLTGMIISLFSIIVVQVLIRVLLHYNAREGKTDTNRIYYMGWLVQILTVLINMSNYIAIV